MTAVSKTHVRRIRIHVPDDALSTTILRGIAFRAGDADGWKGPYRKTYAEARKDARLHRLAE